MSWYQETIKRVEPKLLSPSEDCISIIENFEGFRSEAYQDSVGVWSIGYGTTRGVQKGDTITKEDASARMLIELEEDYSSAVQNLVKVPLTQYEFDALSCFTYNLGATNLMNSTLLRKLNLNSYELAAKEFPKWAYAGGKLLQGLVYRRKAEQLMFLGEDWKGYKEALA